MTCPVHGPGCYGIPEECMWIEADIARRVAEGECLNCGLFYPERCPDCAPPAPGVPGSPTAPRPEAPEEQTGAPNGEPDA